MTEVPKMLIDKILERKSFDSVSNILNGYHLEDIQAVDVMAALCSKRSIFRYDTGTGKTLLASAVMKLLKREDSSRKFIMVVKNNQLIQTPIKIKESTGLSIITTTAEASQLKEKMFSGKFLNYDIVMITHECLNNVELMNLLHTFRNKFYGLIIDEAHELSNYVTSSSALMLKAVSRNMEVVYALTATPMQKDIEQLVRLMHIVDPFTIPSVRDTIHWIKSDKRRLKSCWSGLILSRTRADFGIKSNYITKVHKIEPLPEQVGANGINMFKLTRGEGATRQVTKLVEIIKGHLPTHGLIYIRQHAIRKFVESELEKAGIAYGSINGRTKMSDKTEIIKTFNEGKLDVILTSITTALDLDCDYIVFYEFTLDFKQMLGRAERGLNPKTLYIHFLFTKNTAEANYFMKYIYGRSLLVKDIMGQECNEILQAANQLRYHEDT